MDSPNRGHVFQPRKGHKNGSGHEVTLKNLVIPYYQRECSFWKHLCKWTIAVWQFRDFITWIPKPVAQNDTDILHKDSYGRKSQESQCFGSPEWDTHPELIYINEGFTYDKTKQNIKTSTDHSDSSTKIKHPSRGLKKKRCCKKFIPKETEAQHFQYHDDRTGPMVCDLTRKIQWKIVGCIL